MGIERYFIPDETKEKIQKAARTGRRGGNDDRARSRERGPCGLSLGLPAKRTSSSRPDSSSASSRGSSRTSTCRRAPFCSWSRRSPAASRVLAAYREAVSERYRFYSFGDAMLLDPVHVCHNSRRGSERHFSRSLRKAPVSNASSSRRRRTPCSKRAGCSLPLFRPGGKVLVFGNGGSAADSQHFAAELVNRFRSDRPAFAAIALTTDTSILTSIANDSDFESVFSRQVEALGAPGDVAVAISTSGSVSQRPEGRRDRARERPPDARARRYATAGSSREAVDLCLTVPHRETARIQEVHSLLIHLFCEMIDSSLYPGGR